MVLRILLAVSLLVMSCVSPPLGSAEKPKDEPIQAEYIEVLVYRCATDTEMASGPVSMELWGLGWHYVEYRVLCRQA